MTHRRRPTRRVPGVLAAFAVALLLTTSGAAVGQDAPAAPAPAASTQAERCAALLAETPASLARWLAERNDISLVRATAVVGEATAQSCGP